MFLKNLQNSQESACVRDSSTLSKKIVQHRCFPVNIAKFLRRDFFIEHLIKNHSKKIMPNCYVNFGSSISSYSSWGFSPAQPLLFLTSFGNLGTFIMGEWGVRIRIRKKHHFEWLLSWYSFSSYNYCYDVLFLSIRRNHFYFTEGLM